MDPMYSLEDIDIFEILDDKEDLKDMVEFFVPRMFKPEIYPGFSGVDLVGQDFLIKHFDPEETQPIISGVMDLAGWYRAAGMVPKDPIMYIAFLETGRPWGHTYYCLMECISRIMIISSEGKDFAESSAGLQAAERQTKSILRSLFSKEDSESIINIAVSTTRKIVEGAD